MGVVKYLLLVIVGLGLLAACSSEPAVICNVPYLLVGTECCLDSDASGICDVDEGVAPPTRDGGECPELDCSLCPAKVIERNVTNTKKVYICADNMQQVEDAKECDRSTVNAFAAYVPVAQKEGTAIREFSVRPACRERFNAIEIHYSVGSVPDAVTIQVKESPLELWRDLYTLSSGNSEKYLYGALCPSFCTSNIEFYLAPEKAYLLRGKFDFTTIYGEVQYSSELVVDARKEGEFMTKLCSPN